MKIKRDEINQYIKYLKDIPFKPLGKEVSTIFFEIDTGKMVENDGFILEIKDSNEAGSKALVKPGLMLSCKDTGKKLVTEVSLAYAQTDYCPKFNLDAYLDLTNASISRKERDILTNLDVLLVKKDYILGEFEI